MVTEKITIGPEIGLIAEASTKIIIQEEETTIEVVIETTDPITGIVVGPKTETITEMWIGPTIGQIIQGTTVTKGDGNRNQECGRSRERERGRSSSRETSQSQGGNQSNNRDQGRNDNRRQSRNNTRHRSESRSRSRSHVSTNRDRCRCCTCNEYDHLARECPNEVTDGSSDDIGGSLLRMLYPMKLMH